MKHAEEKLFFEDLVEVVEHDSSWAPSERLMFPIGQIAKVIGAFNHKHNPPLITIIRLDKSRRTASFINASTVRKAQ